jgi:CHAD domain-containing protein
MLRLIGVGQSPEEAATELQTTARAVTRARAAFERQRLELFPRPALFLDELLEAARVDLAHARQVADLALRLFDLTPALHRLPPRTRELLEAAALLHNVGVEVDEPNHHSAGRDLLRHASLVGYSEAEQTMLACAVRFHRKRVRPHKEPLFVSLTPRQQSQTLALTALLRVADGLDYAQSQTTQIESLTLAEDRVVLSLRGPHSVGDGARALAKADVWWKVFGAELRLPEDWAALASQPLSPESPLKAVVQRGLADQWTRWQKETAEARAGEPPAVKAVRAAARRARAALALFRAYLKKKPAQALRRSLKAAEDILGQVRDWDVLLADAKQYAADSTEGDAILPLITDWERQRQTALAEAAAWLSSAEADRTQAALADFIRDLPLKQGGQRALADEAEAILLTPVGALAERAGAVGGHDLAAYHRLRLALKPCRFALEFLAPAYGAPAEALLKDIIKAQDRLGYINDTHVAQERIAALLAERHDPHAEDYLLACQTKIERHLQKLEKEWAVIEPAALRRRLRALIGR